MNNYNKYIKALLLIANQKGIDVNYETKCSYSENYNCIITKRYLKIWHKSTKIDKKTGEEKESIYCTTEEFTGAKKEANIISYLKKCIEEKSNGN